VKFDQRLLKEKTVKKKQGGKGGGIPEGRSLEKKQMVIMDHFL